MKKKCPRCGNFIKPTPMEAHLSQLEAKRDILRRIKDYTGKVRQNHWGTISSESKHEDIFNLCIAIEQLVRFCSYDLNKHLVKHELDTVKLTSKAGTQPQDELEDKECNLCSLPEESR